MSPHTQMVLLNSGLNLISSNCLAEFFTFLISVLHVFNEPYTVLIMCQT